MSTRRPLRSALDAPVVVAIVVAAVLAASGLTVSAQPAPVDPQLFDLDLAQRELGAIQADIVAQEAAIADVLAGIDGLAIELDFLTLNAPARADALIDARTNARRMAVAAYIGFSPPLSGLDLLDAETASDLSWRNALMRHQAERLHATADSYALLNGELDANSSLLSDQINAKTRELESLNRSLAQTRDKIPRAEWYVEIATIHDFASQEFARTGRSEPSAEQWRQLRFCESTETYDIDTGNTFYGAYQFTWDTWGTVGGSDNPAHAPPAEQDARARLLYAQRGDQPWPICGRYVRYPDTGG